MERGDILRHLVLPGSIRQTGSVPLIELAAGTRAPADDHQLDGGRDFPAGRAQALIQRSTGR